jgi:hypothetical protein
MSIEEEVESQKPKGDCFKRGQKGRFNSIAKTSLSFFHLIALRVSNLIPIRR